MSEAQGQTREAFGFKWAKRDTFEGRLADNMRSWLIEKYGDVTNAEWLFQSGKHPIVLDAGCGAALSGLALFEPVLDRLRYVGVDVSDAVDVAKQRFHERGLPGEFVQADLLQLPLAEQSVDLIFSEGVLHHTDDTRAALAAVVRHLKVGGRMLFYVYRRKGPIREFTDDYIRERLQAMSPQNGWDAVMPLTKLGKVLGDLGLTVEVPEHIELLGIPAGKIDIQRLFYWHVFKAFHQPQMTLEEMNHINFDWYAPRNAHRQTPEDVRDWCASLGLVIEHERIEEAGITVIARRS
ncbi:class I SAM-dependent methyltransferase [Afipia clevelandensis]|uniref:class I SAM-dependent methyltransferase n=1 Tax=Afipia clevelandensis TaxID=1034 RepID=UPI00058BAD95|nr:class I SAM-dependent methyltransferase [Afipia clevelandensis]